MGEGRDKKVSRLSSNSDILEDYTSKILMYVDGMHAHLKVIEPLNVRMMGVRKKGFTRTIKGKEKMVNV